MGPALTEAARDILGEAFTMMMEDELLEDPPWVDAPDYHQRRLSPEGLGWVNSLDG